MTKLKPRVATLAEVVAGRIREIRRARRWTQEDLARRLADIGHPMSQVTISRIESGADPGAPPAYATRARNLSVVDAFAVAAALSVRPDALFGMFPAGVDAVAVTPEIVVDALAVGRWLRGEAPIAARDEADERAFLTEVPTEALRRRLDMSLVAVIRRAADLGHSFDGVAEAVDALAAAWEALDGAREALATAVEERHRPKEVAARAAELLARTAALDAAVRAAVEAVDRAQETAAGAWDALMGEVERQQEGVYLRMRRQTRRWST